MPIDFPASPTNGQVYGTYVYDSSITAWRNLNTDAGATQLATSVGLRNIVPTSIAKGASGSATVNSNGTVSFTGTESVSLNGVFTSAYKNYNILISNVSGSIANVSMYFRLRNAGTDRSDANYAGRGLFASSSTSGLWTDTGTQVSLINLDTTAYGSSTVTLHNPENSSHRTTYQNSGTGIVSSSYVWVGSAGLYQVANTSDGMTIYPSSGNFTGTVQVFGYNN